MDWTPGLSLLPVPLSIARPSGDEEDEEDSSWQGFMRAPRVFSEGADATGLESLLGGWVLADEAEDTRAQGGGRDAQRKGPSSWWGRWVSA